MKIENSIKVNYKHTTDATTLRTWLKDLPAVISCDFETAVKYTNEEIEIAKVRMEDTSYDFQQRTYYKTVAGADALGHPSHCTLTHCSIAADAQNAFVAVLDNKAITDEILNFLVTTDKVQIWHNYCFDGKHIRWFTGKDAKNLEDTRILARTLTNHAKQERVPVGLKDLAGRWYGDWAISSDCFTKEQMYEDFVIRYAAIDACATYKLWEHLNNYIKTENGGP